MKREDILGGRVPKDLVGRELYIPPLPMRWFVKACSLPGGALGVGCLIWFRYKTSGEKFPLRFSRRNYEFANISRYCVRRALVGLEKAGLIMVERNRSKAPLITVVLDEKKSSALEKRKSRERGWQT